MIIWKGFGILVVIIAILSIAIVQLVARAATNDPHFGETHHWVGGLALIIAAVPVFFVGRYFNTRPGRVVIDKATKRELVIRRTHSLFFIPMEYWAIILPLIGFGLMFAHPAQN